jgi:hypothetical protein
MAIKFFIWRLQSKSRVPEPLHYWVCNIIYSSIPSFNLKVKN